MVVIVLVLVVVWVSLCWFTVGVDMGLCWLWWFCNALMWVCVAFVMILCWFWFWFLWLSMLIIHLFWILSYPITVNFQLLTPPPPLENVNDFVFLFLPKMEVDSGFALWVSRGSSRVLSRLTGSKCWHTLAREKASFKKMGQNFRGGG